MRAGVLRSMMIGFKNLIGNWKLLFGFYVFNFIFAAILTLPFISIFANDISRSLTGRDLLFGFNNEWLVEFVGYNGNYFKSLLPQVILIIVIYILVEVFFSGGFYSSYSRVEGIHSNKDRIKFGEFLERGSSFFFPLLFIAGIESTILFLLYIGINHYLSMTGFQIIGIILFMAVNLFSDFIRTAIVIDKDGFWKKVYRGLSFTVHHLLSTIEVYACCLLIGAVVTASYLLFRLTDDSTTSQGIFNEMLVSQIFILLRIFSKLNFYAMEAALYKENQIEVIKVKPEMLE